MNEILFREMQLNPPFTGFMIEELNLLKVAPSTLGYDEGLTM